MNSDDEFLYNQFIISLFESNSCLTSLIFLKDYRNVINSEIENYNEHEDVKNAYTGLYRHHVNAEKIKRYIEQNKIKCYSLNEWDLFIELKNGDKFIYDSFNNTVNFNLYENGELTEEQEIKEFTKNLRKLLARKYMTQEELAERIGVSRITINRYMNGKQFPDAMVLRKMSKVLNCSIEDFFYKDY